MKKKGIRSRTTTPLVTRTRARARARRPRAAAVAAEFLETPLPVASSPSQSPESAIFRNSTRRRKKADSPASPRPLVASPSPSPSRPPAKALGSIADLKDMASSRVDDLKRHIDRSHAVIIKELDASYSRLHKRFKVSLWANLPVCLDGEKIE